MDWLEVIPAPYMSRTEKMLAVGRLLVFVVVICILLQNYALAQAGIIAIGAILLIYIVDTGLLYENFDEIGIANTNAPFAVPNPDPRLYTAVVPPPRSHDMHAWDSRSHSHINYASATPVGRAGFVVPEAMPAQYITRPPRGSHPHTLRLAPEFAGISKHDPHPRQQPPGEHKYSPSLHPGEQKYTYTYGPSLPGDVNEGCGWNPDKLLLLNNPTNQPMSAREYDPQFKEYNENRRTGIIQPGVYTKTEIHEPQITNMGISFAQQFAPVQQDNYADKIVYTQKDPRLVAPLEAGAGSNSECRGPEMTFDPRSHGYGDARRFFIEPVTGQPRWYYDDIDGSRADPFLSRTVLPEFVASSANANQMHHLADEAFIDATNQHRIDLQERQMRKANEMRRQQRLAPIRRF